MSSSTQSRRQLASRPSPLLNSNPNRPRNLGTWILSHLVPRSNSYCGRLAVYSAFSSKRRRELPGEDTEDTQVFEVRRMTSFLDSGPEKSFHRRPQRV